MEFIFIHGLGQGPSSWNLTLNNLEDRFHIHCPDLPQLVKGEKVIYPLLYRRFVEYCESKNQPLHLCGLSLGAVLALNYAIDYPEKAASLTLIAPQFKMPKFLLTFQSMIFRCLPGRAFHGMGFNKKDFLHLTGTIADLDFSKDIGK